MIFRSMFGYTYSNWEIFWRLLGWAKGLILFIYTQRGAIQVTSVPFHVIITSFSYIFITMMNIDISLFNQSITNMAQEFAS